MNYGLKTAIILSIFFLFSPVVFTNAQQNMQTLLPIPRAIIPTTSTIANPIDYIDLIVEANTYVPPSYQGRREPTRGSEIRLIAILPPGIEATSFRWQVGSTNLTSTLPDITVTVPEFENVLRATVTAVDRSGKALGNATEAITLSEPKILFYENNSLRGASSVAVKDSLTLIGDEVTIKAEPYFFASGSTLAGVTGNWFANDLEVIANKTEWREAALRPASTTGEATSVQLDVRNSNRLSETISGTLKIMLGL